MIKFFRKIRQSSLVEGKTGKYLKYAIGEILLVMIGILLALQVSNWNKSRADRHQEQAILRQLKIEFTNNLKQLDSKIYAKESLMVSALKLFKYIDDPYIRNKDSLDLFLGRTIPFSTFDPIVNDLANSGNIRLIRSDSLKLLLSLWTSNIKDVQEDELGWKFYRNEFYIPFLVENYQLRTVRKIALEYGLLNGHLIESEDQKNPLNNEFIGPSKYDVDINDLLENPDFEDHLERALSTNRFAHSQSLILKERIEEILNIINKELDEEYQKYNNGYN
jgi:hypothetical protein